MYKPVRNVLDFHLKNIDVYQGFTITFVFYFILCIFIKEKYK